jgi:aspartate/methionine/tyrosine aminotransferase
MVDEVYLDMARDTASTPPPRSCFHLGNNFVVTNSLTKAYGLSGLRCGWILAQPRLAERIWRLSDLFFGIPPHPAELLSVIALDHLDRIDARAQSLLHANRIALNDFLDRNSQIEVVPPKWGTVLFPRLLHGSVNEFCALLLSKYETTVVPGHFFEMPDHFRIGIGGDTATTARGLVQLRKCLEDGEQKTGLAPI